MAQAFSSLELGRMKPVLIALAFLGVIAGAFALNRRSDAAYERDLAKWKLQKHVDDSVLAVRVDESYRAGLANAKSIPVYLEGKARIISDAAPSPQAAAAVRACFELADKRISACEASRKADSAVIVAQRNTIKTLEEKPEPREKRFVFFGAAGYSVRGDSSVIQFAPAIRAGLDSKLIGPIRLTTDAQLSLPGRGRSKVLWQGNVLARINF